MSRARACCAPCLASRCDARTAFSSSLVASRRPSRAALLSIVKSRPGSSSISNRDMRMPARSKTCSTRCKKASCERVASTKFANQSCPSHTISRASWRSLALVADSRDGGMKGLRSCRNRFGIILRRVCDAVRDSSISCTELGSSVAVGA